MKYNERLYAEHLQKMVQIPTVSYENEEDFNFDNFFMLHQYLEQAYPLTHQNLEKTLIGPAGLLYRWKGSMPSDKLPMMLLAHQDVVSAGDEAQWTYPPFSGTIADGFIWGRGTTDCKCNIQAYFDALEQLIEDGFCPKCDVYIGLGYNEELVGKYVESSAKKIADLLQKRNVQLGCLLDEGGGIKNRPDGKKYAFIYVGEKGVANIRFVATDQGGHSSIPGPSTALGKICQAGYLIEHNPSPAQLLPIVAQQLKISAPYMDNKQLSALCQDVEKNWDELLPLLENDREYNALIRTTTALTMAQGSEQANVLPEKASLVANCRLLPGDTIDDLLNRLKQYLPDDISIELVWGSNPPDMSSHESEGYKILNDTIKQIYGNIPVMPCLLYGGTDSRYFTDLSPTKSVYRFTCLQYDDRWDGLWHKTDERIPLDILSDNVKFYYNFIRNYSS